VRRILSVILLLCMVLSASGCWDSEPIEKKDITTAVLVDKTETGYAFYVEIASLAVKGGQSEGGGGGSSSSSAVIFGEGPTFVDAREAVDRQTDKPLYLAGVQCVVFSERMAYSGIEEYMYRFRQNPEYRKTAVVAVTGEAPDDLFRAASENNTLIGSAINDTLESLEQTGLVSRMTMGDVLEILSSDCGGYLIPRFGLTEREKDIEFNGFCVMDGDTYVGQIPIEEGEFTVFIRGDRLSFRYALSYQGHDYTLEIQHKKKSPKIHYENGEIRIELRFNCSADILYIGENRQVDNTMLAQVEAALKQQLTEEFIKVIRTSQEMFKLDYFQFCDAFRIRYPDEFKQMNWKEQYPHAKVTVDVAVDLRQGTMDYEPEG
jgi:spore germination protein KC